MMPSNKSVRTELNFYGPQPRVRDMVAVNTIANKFKCPAVVTESVFFDQLFQVRNQTQSKYAIYVVVDKDGRTFGMNKMYSIPNINTIDGLEVILTKGKNKTDLLNEINSITQFLRMAGRPIAVRWGILVTAGETHISNCIDAIKTANSKIKNDALIKLIFKPRTDKAIIKSVIDTVRAGLGQEKTRVKINIYSEADIDDDLGISYDVDAAVLM